MLNILMPFSANPLVPVIAGAIVITCTLIVLYFISVAQNIPDDAASTDNTTFDETDIFNN